MTAAQLVTRLRSLIETPLPLPGHGKTALRHQSLVALGRENLSLARLAEAHYDAVAILAEAGRRPAPDAIYGVWASEVAGCPLRFDAVQNVIQGAKMFCSGAGLIDRALITVGPPQSMLFEIDLRGQGHRLRYDDSAWKTTAFAETQTSTVFFDAVAASTLNLVGEEDWYARRPGFWHGACGPAACWAGGAIGLVDYAARQSRADPHTLAHLGAMQAAAWAMQAFLTVAGDQIDEDPYDPLRANIRALTVRHLIEQACTETLRRLSRAHGPRPLAMDACISRRYQELDLYLRQCHAERDLEVLGRCVRR